MTDSCMRPRVHLNLYYSRFFQKYYPVFSRSVNGQYHLFFHAGICIRDGNALNGPGQVSPSGSDKWV
jgi:hypothetical protein